MKKLTVFISFFIFFLVFSFSVYAQSPNLPSSTEPKTSCWTRHMTIQMTACTKDHTNCLQVCAPMESSKRLPCFAECNSVANICRKKASTDYNACVKGNSQSSEEGAAKQLKPSGGNQITCAEAGKIIDSGQCPNWTNKPDVGLWCNLPFGDINAYKNTPPTYIYAPGETCEDSQGSEQQAQSQQSQSDQAVQLIKQSKGNSNGSSPSIFGFNPLETWRNIQALLQIPQGLNDLVETGEFFSGLKDIPMTIPQPSIATDEKGNPWDFLPGYIPHESIKPDSVIRVTEGTRLTDKDGQNFYELRPGQGNQAVLKIPEKDSKDQLFLEEGEIEVVRKQSGVSDSLYEGIKTPNGSVISVQTHYLVSYDKKNNQTKVVVYEGKVEVRTNDGKTTTITPESTKPGIVVIAQKLSIVKFAIAVIILIVIVSGAIFFPKKGGNKILRLKKRR